MPAEAYSAGVRNAGGDWVAQSQRRSHSRANAQFWFTCPPPFQSTNSARWASTRKMPGVTRWPAAAKKNCASGGVAVRAQAASDASCGVCNCG